MLAEHGLKQESASISCDGSSILHMCKDLVYHQNTKHINIKLHFIINEFSRGVTKIMKIHTKNISSAMLNKVVSIVKFREYLDLVGICILWFALSG